MDGAHATEGVMTQPKERWNKRSDSGKYKAGPRCDGCGKPTGDGYMTDEEVCGNTDGPGFYLCTRERCMKQFVGMDVEERRAHYALWRAK